MAMLSAHRGGPEGRLVPNALTTIEAACALGVDLVEFDVRVPAPGHYRIGHDEASETTLLEVLEAIRGRARAHVDLKDTGDEIEIVDVCIRILGPDGFLLTTRSDASIRRVRTARPEVMVGLTLGRAPIRLGRLAIPLLLPGELIPWRRLRRCGANLIAAQDQLARFSVLRGAGRRGLPVLVWTLNAEAQLRAVQADPRVWAYTTDYPRLARQLAVRP